MKLLNVTEEHRLGAFLHIQTNCSQSSVDKRGSGYLSDAPSSLEEDGGDNLSLHCIFPTDFITHMLSIANFWDKGVSF